MGPKVSCVAACLEAVFVYYTKYSTPVFDTCYLLTRVLIAG